jgi:hypothetical protein
VDSAEDQIVKPVQSFAVNLSGGGSLLLGGRFVECLPGSTHTQKQFLLDCGSIPRWIGRCTIPRHLDELYHRQIGEAIPKTPRRIGKILEMAQVTSIFAID